MAPRLPAALRIARAAHAFALLPTLFMLLSLPIPPAGAEVRSLVLLLACAAGSVAVVYGITRRRPFAPWLAVLLGIYGLFSLAAILLRGAPSAGTAGVASMVIAGSVSACYVVALLCCAGALRAQPRHG